MNTKVSCVLILAYLVCSMAQQYITEFKLTQPPSSDPATVKQAVYNVLQGFGVQHSNNITITHV